MILELHYRETVLHLIKVVLWWHYVTKPLC